MSDLVDAVSGIVHASTQTGGPGLDLTVASVHEPTGPGQVDFGGGELAPAETTELDPEKRDPDDDYGWWELDAGIYLLEHNERLDAGEPVTLAPRAELVERGAFHPTLRVVELPRTPLIVPDSGIDIKENARVSTLHR
jgi:hypothetical protein